MCSDEPLNEQPVELTRYGAIYSAGLTIEGDPKSVLTVSKQNLKICNASALWSCKRP